MPTISIDGKDYDLDELTENVKANITSLKFIESEINRIKLKEAAMLTARNAYALAIKEGITEDDSQEQADASGSIQFD